MLNHFKGFIYTYETSEIFLDIGTPEKYNQANKQENFYETTNYENNN